MKITRIQSDNILGTKSIDVHLTTPVALFAGRNGSGKSSLQEAVRMAITQDNVRDITTKKTFGALVREGEKAGGAVVTIDGDSEKSFAFNMPKGEFVGPEIGEPMRVALLGQRFARMSTDERRTFLFGLTKLKASAATVKPRMLSKKWGCEEVKVDAVLPLLRTGFPGVCDHAKSKATESKGVWRQLTGEAYGAVKAQSWEAPLPELPGGDSNQLSEAVAGYDRNIAKLNESLGAIKNTARQAAEAAARREKLAGAAGKVTDVAEQLELAKKELAEYEPQVMALRQRAAGTARVGLVHDMAAFLDTVLFADEDQCGESKKLLSRYESEHGKLTAGQPDPEAVAALPDHEKGLTVLRNRVTNLQRDLDSATQAKGQFDALAPAGEPIDASAEIAEIEGMLADAQTARAAAYTEMRAIDDAKYAREAAQGKTKAAAAAHADVVAWTKVADALAPNGIPSEMLAEALAPVNLLLAQAAVDTEWMQVDIGNDMSITAAGRAYNLLSESEQWRVDAMIAQVVAELSGIKILMLDRVDVLDLPGRAQLLEWVDSLAFNNIIDTVLLFGTFKALPEGLADTVTSYWVDNGTIAATSTAPQQAAA
jgi:hypothetical protein